MGRHDHTASWWRPTRRELLGAGGALALGGCIGETLTWWNSHESGLRERVFIGRASGYDTDLVQVVTRGFGALGITAGEISGKRILLKPNLVETAAGQTHINTHPAMVVSVAETFRRLGASEVIVAEGQGHRRDSCLVLDESGMGKALDDAGLSFIDLNHDEVVATGNAGSRTGFEWLYLPKTLLAADWVVSMPKLKTHHWTGVTCAMRNLFGVMPGVIYGWPKNPLHYAGITESILDINTTLRPALSIVDGIVGMEGDGPIMGSPKYAGSVIMGRNATAVDATCVRVMGLNPYGVTYLTGASGRLGPIHESNISQCGETIESVRTPFELLDMPHIVNVRFE